MTKTEFEIGVQHSEILDEIIVELLVVSEGGSVITGAISTSKAVNLVAKTYKRVKDSPEQLFEDSIDAINAAF